MASQPPTMLEFDDIQHIVLTRVPAITGRYEFLSFGEPSRGRRWLAGIIEKIESAQAAAARMEAQNRWVSVAFTWTGLRALGLNEVSLASFPEEFRQGMPARWQVLGDTGANHPDHWIEGISGPQLLAIAILFARNATERQRSTQEHQAYLARTPGVKILSSLDLDAIPPFDYARDHFGYRDRLTQPEIEGTGIEPTPGSGPPIKPGEFILGYPDEAGQPINLPQPEVLSRNGSFMAYRRLEEHVSVFRQFLRQYAQSPDDQELLAAKLMGRWRSGAPLVLASKKDDRALAADSQRNNNFNFAEMDPHGYAVPLGAHIRRLNPRDTGANMRRRKMLRRGATYGPPLPDGAPDDGIERGVAA